MADGRCPECTGPTAATVVIRRWVLASGDGQALLWESGESGESGWGREGKKADGRRGVVSQEGGNHHKVPFY